jgi:drug/metabolite transporter (DMT)-like permease
MTMSIPPSSSDNMRAAALMSFTMALFATNDMLVKLLLGSLPPGQIMALRNLLVVGILTGFLVLRHRRVVLAHIFDRIALARGVIEVAITFSFFISLQLMPLADAAVLTFAAPIIMTAGVAIMGTEKVGPRRWAAVIAGFCGVVLVAGPSSATLGPAALLPLFTACLVAARDLITRLVPKTHDSTSVAMTTAGAVALGGLLSLPLGAIGVGQPWAMPSGFGILVIIAMAVLVSASYTTLVISFRMGEMSLLAAFRYTAIPVSIMWSWTVFGDVPSATMLMGASIIVGSGIFIFTRERQLARRAKLADGR